MTELDNEEPEVVAVGEEVESQLSSQDQPVERGEHGGEVEEHHEGRQVRGQHYKLADEEGCDESLSLTKYFVDRNWYEDESEH